MPATRWGIVSAGNISNDWAVAVSLLPKDEHVIVAVAARKIEAAAEFAKIHNIPKVHKTYEDVFADPEIDVVYIGTLHTEHLRLCKQALSAGKPVLCEKPLAMNIKETKEIVEIARKNNVFLMEAIWSRFFPAYDKLREELANGTIGEVYQVIAEMGLAFDENNWRRDKAVGGGTVLDMGTYTCQLASLVYKGLNPIKYAAGGHLNSSGADDCSSATILYPGGKTATLITQSKVDMPCNALIIGTKGTIRLHFPFWSTTKIETPNGTFEYPLPTTDKFTNYPSPTGLAYQCKEVRRCLAEGLKESPMLSLDETIFLAEMRETIRKQIGVHYPQDN